jgi:hypothetical protein
MGWWRAFFLAATDSPAVYGEGAGLVALSTLTLGNRWLNIGSGIRPNLYMLLTGDSSVARKSTAVRYARKAIEEINPGLVGPRDYTMEGLYKWMSQKDEGTGKSRNKFCLFSEEFGSDLARTEAYGGTFKEDMCALYDGDDFTKVRAKSDSLTISKPRVNLLGGVAYPLLTRYCSKDDWFTGFLMRFLFVSPVEMRARWELQPPFPRSEWDTAVQALAALYEEMRDPPKAIGLSKPAEALYLSFLKSIPVMDSKDDVAPVYTQRLGPNVLKLALLYQLDDDPHSDVSDAAMQNAISFCHYCLWPSFRKAYKMSTLNDFDSALSHVMELAAREDGVAKAEVYTVYAARQGLPDGLLSFMKRSGRFERVLNAVGQEAYKLLNE